MRCRRSPGPFTLWASSFWMRDPKHTILLALSFTGQVITMGLGVVSGNLMSWVSQSRATSRWMLTTRFLISERSPFPWNSWTEAPALRRVSALCHRICIQSEYNRAPSLSPLQGCSLLSLVSIMIFGWTPSNTQVQWSSARATHKYNDLRLQQHTSTMIFSSSNTQVQWSSAPATHKYNDLRLQQHTLSKLTVSKELRSSSHISSLEKCNVHLSFIRDTLLLTICGFSQYLDLRVWTVMTNSNLIHFRFS